MISKKNLDLNIFEPIQYKIGRLWQMNMITVAHEHYATGLTQMLIADPYILESAEKTGKMNSMNSALVSDFFEMKGWNYNIGANTPQKESIIKIIQEPELLLISTTIT